MAALPDPSRTHRGEHSYTVAVPWEDSDGHQASALIDVLLRTQAFYVKKPVENKGQVSWKKNGGPCKAWALAVRQAKSGPKAN